MSLLLFNLDFLDILSEAFLFLFLFLDSFDSEIISVDRRHMNTNNTVAMFCTFDILIPILLINRLYPCTVQLILKLSFVPKYTFPKVTCLYILAIQIFVFLTQALPLSRKTKQS